MRIAPAALALSPRFARAAPPLRHGRSPGIDLTVL